MKDRIVIISEYFYPNERTDAFLLTEITTKLAETNSGNIKVICTSELNDKEEIKSLDTKVIRLKNINLNEQKILLRIFKFIVLTMKLSLVALFTIKKNDRVFVTTNPAFLIPVLSILRCIQSFEYTVLVYDVFPENIAATDIISNKGLFYRLIKKIYDWSYSKADRLIVLGRDMKEVLFTKTTNKVPIHIIENWCDYRTIVPQKKVENPILNSLGLLNKKVFLFAGNLGRVQGLETLLEVSQLIKDPDFALLFIGEGSFKSKIIKFIDTNKKNNVYYGGSFLISDQNKFLNACDIAIISLNSNMYGLGVPSKSYYNMAAQKPILYIGDEKSEIGRLISEFDIGWNVKPNDMKELINVIEDICEDISAVSHKGIEARRIVKENFSKEIILEKYQNLYEVKK